MRILKAVTISTAALASTCNAFAPVLQSDSRYSIAVASTPTTEYDSSETSTEDAVAKTTMKTKGEAEGSEKPKVAAKKSAPHGTSGVFAPAVLLVKDIWGDVAAFNKFRAKIILLHSDVIKSFVDTAESKFGQATLNALFRLADKDQNGTIDRDELEAAFAVLGFDFLKEKQLQGIFDKADIDGNGVLDKEEFLKAAPPTLKSNLIKLAKKNGGDLGFLA